MGLVSSGTSSCGSVTFHVTTPVGAPYVVLTSSRTVPHALVPYTEALLSAGTDIPPQATPEVMVDEARRFREDLRWQEER